MTDPRLTTDIRHAITALTEQDIERRGDIALARRVVDTPPLIEWVGGLDAWVVRLPDGELVATFSGNLVAAAVAYDRNHRASLN